MDLEMDEVVSGEVEEFTTEDMDDIATEEMEGMLDGEVEELITEENKPGWFKLPPKLHELIIGRLDYKSRRALRSTCVENRNLLNQYKCMQYSKYYFCHLEATTLADGQKSFSMLHWVGNSRADCVEQFQLFATAEELIDGMQKTMQKIHTLNYLVLVVNGFSTPFELFDARYFLIARNLHFHMNSDPIVVNGFFEQFDAGYVKSYNLHGNFLGEWAFAAYKAETLHVHCRATDAQLLSIRSRKVKLFDGSDITIFALKLFFQKMIRRKITSEFSLAGMSEEQMMLFDCRQRRTRGCFPICSHQYKTKLVLTILHEPPAPMELSAKLFPIAKIVEGQIDEAGYGLELFLQSILRNF